MKNKNALAFSAVAMICLVIACALMIVFLTKPQKNASNNLTTEDIAFESSTVVPSESNAVSTDTDFSEESVESLGSSQEEELPPELILPPEAILRSKIAVVYDLAEDAVIFQRDSEVQTSPASLTKMVTALVALDHLSPTQTLTVGDEINMIGENSSTAFLAVGQKYSVKSLLDALLIPSGNDAAYVLAVNTARTAANDRTLSKESAVSDFVRLMNEKVKSLGCFSTIFFTPDGYDAEGQHTTAADMLKISKAAYANTHIKESVSKEKSKGWVNSNLLIRTDSSLYNECVTGLKTGSTSGAGYCVAVSAVVDQKTYIMVFMNSDTSSGRFEDANTIISLIKGETAEESVAA